MATVTAGLELWQLKLLLTAVIFVVGFVGVAAPRLIFREHGASSKYGMGLSMGNMLSAGGMPADPTLHPPVAVVAKDRDTLHGPRRSWKLYLPPTPKFVLPLTATAVFVSFCSHDERSSCAPACGVL